MVASADNLDFIHSYARVYCSNQQSSWHGTTVQLVQPQPSKLVDSISVQPPQPGRETTSTHAQMTTNTSTENESSIHHPQTPASGMMETRLQACLPKWSHSMIQHNLLLIVQVNTLQPQNDAGKWELELRGSSQVQTPRNSYHPVYVHKII